MLSVSAVAVALYALFPSVSASAATIKPTSESGATARAVLEANYSTQDAALVQAGSDADLAQVKTLLNEGANVNAVVNGQTALTGAAAWGNFTLCMYLLSRGANPNICGHNSPTPLTNAVESKNVELVAALIHSGARINLPGALGETPLMRAAINGNAQVAKYLIKLGASLNQPNSAGLTALFCAADIGGVDVAKVLLVSGANVNALSSSGYTPLMLAVRRGHPEMVRFLLAHGADVNHSTDRGDTALIQAISSCSAPVVNMLLAAGAKPDTQNAAGQTPLMYAASYGCAEAAQALLASHADPTLVDNNNADALTYLAGFPLQDPTGAPVSHAATIADRKLAGKLAKAIMLKSPARAADALCLSAANGRTAVVDGIIDAGLPVDGLGDHSLVNYLPAPPSSSPSTPLSWPDVITPLMGAAMEGKADVIRELLTRGADPGLKTPEGLTAFDIAARAHQDVASAILQGATAKKGSMK